jgi:YD repeat-containing protein
MRLTRPHDLRARFAGVRRLCLGARALVLGAFFLGFGAAAQPLIDDVRIDFRGEVKVQVGSVTNRYYVLLAGAAVTAIDEPVDVRRGTGDSLALHARRLPNPDASFFQVLEVLESSPLDLDQDGMDDFWELGRPGSLDALNSADAALDPDGNGRSHLFEYQQARLPLTTVRETSPADGETGVSPTRETVLRFSRPLAPSASLTPDSLFAEFAGRRVLSRAELSGDRRTATLFYLEPLPGSARIRVKFDGEGLKDAWDRALDADGDGEAGGVRGIEFDTVSLTPSADAVVCGRVFASQLAPGSDPEGPKSLNVPLAGVIITADGLEETVRTETDALGNFCLRNAPAGEFFVHIDGRPVTDVGQGIRYPDLSYYPYVGKLWKSIPGREVNIGEIYLPLVADGTLMEVSPTADTVVTFPEAVVAEHPELAGVTLTVPANSLYSENGTRGGRVGIAPVPPDRLPEPLPEGLGAPLVITVQTDGPANFDQPVPVCFPNLPDPQTGEALPPGAKTGLWSFNHDLGRWEVVGPMTISPDGRFACSDPGYGIRQPGWHFPNPGTSGEGGGDGPETGDPPPPTGKNQSPPGAPGSGGGNGLTCPAPPPPGPPNPTDPIQFHSGEFYHVETDLVIRGVGMDFRWARHYRSKQHPLDSEEAKARVGYSQGWQWDFSYNVFLEQAGAQFYLHDGNHRRDLVFRVRNNWAEQGGGGLYTGSKYGDVVWIQNGLPYELIQQADGTFKVVFPDQGYWEFFPLRARPGMGQDFRVARLAKIVDRNGNTIRLEYDAQDRLVTIFDTLDRPITIGHRPDLYLDSITDFAGRTVRYEYYGPGEAGGWPGDLKAVIRPAVTGTPTGNDFPAGKKTSYTYSVGDRSSRLSHNLLTITDGRRNDPADPTYGQGPWLENQYSSLPNEPRRPPVPPPMPAAAPGDHFASHFLRLSFDRLVRQRWGNGVLEVDYQAFLLKTEDAVRGQIVLTSTDGAAGGGGGGSASGTVIMAPRNEQPIPGYGVHAVVRDRVGNVSEYFYDGLGTPRRYLAYTGRANPNQPTTPFLNRPVGRLRPEDPVFFATDYGSDAQANPDLVLHPNGNRVESVYEQKPRANRNLIARIRRPFERNGAPFGAQPLLTETFEYGSGHGGGCCGFNFVTRSTDGRGHSVINQYDEHGNLTHRVHPIASITEQWEYNSRGQVTKHIHPDNGSGHRRVDVFEYYEAGPSRGYREREIVDFGGLNLTTRYEYDVAGNLVRRIDPNGGDVQYVYNPLDQVVRELSREVKAGVRYRKDYHYDANDNITRIDVDNLDEDGHPLPNARLSTTYEYNLLNSPIRKSEEIAEGHFAVTEYDYDANENLVEIRFPECVAGRQPSNRIRLEYDERNLLFREIRAPGTAEESVTRYDYDGNQNLVRKTEGAGSAAPRVTTQDFDGYDRLVRRTDAMGNVTRFDYDANGNIVASRVEGELHDVPGSAGNVRLSETVFAYDPMNRLVRTEAALFDPATQQPVSGGKAVTEIEYNGLSQVTRLVNPNGHATQIAYDTANRRRTITDAKGNAARYEYDADGNVVELVETEKPDLGGADEVFTTRFEYDALDRLIATLDNVNTAQRFAYDSRNNRVLSVDGRGNVVRYRYDGRNRLTDTIRTLTDTGDGSGQAIGTLTTRQTWDDSGRLTSQIDDNGNATTYLHDGLNRRFATVMADGTGQTNRLDALGNPYQSDDANGTRVLSQFDTLGRVTRKDVTPGPGVSDDTTFEKYQHDGLSRLVRAEDEDSVVELAYDSAGRVVRDVQNGQVVASTYDAAGNQTSITYPSGRLIQQTFDALERLASVADADGVIASYAYVGPGRVARRDTRNGVRMTYQYDGITGVPNPAGDHGVRQIIATTHTRVADAVVLDDRAYAWDRGGNKIELSERHAGGEHRVFAYDSVNRLIRSVRTPAAGAAETIEYKLDGVGNRTEVVGGPDAGAYTMSDAGPEPADRAVNQYTTTPFDTRTYDRNGNLIAINPGQGDARTLTYDFRNRMVGLADSTAAVLVGYKHDVLGRRTRKKATGQAAVEAVLYYSGWRVAEAERGSDVDRIDFVFGRYVDEVLQSRSLSETRFYHSDDLFSTAAIRSEPSGITERFKYGDFGTPLRGGDPTPVSGLGVDEFLFGGVPYDSHARLAAGRRRFLDHRVGRFTANDPLGPWGDPGNLGSASAYCGSSPLTFVDPFGLARLYTDQLGGTTTFDPRPEDPNGMPITIPTRSNAASTAAPGATMPFSSPDVTPHAPIPGRPYSRSYGPYGAYIDVHDPEGRGRNIHGGGSCPGNSYSDPVAPQQGWCPTMGCTRGQNEDVIALANAVRQFKERHPNTAVPYTRAYGPMPVNPSAPWDWSFGSQVPPPSGYSRTTPTTTTTMPPVPTTTTTTTHAPVALPMY